VGLYITKQFQSQLQSQLEYFRVSGLVVRQRTI